MANNKFKNSFMKRNFGKSGLTTESTVSKKGKVKPFDRPLLFFSLIIILLTGNSLTAATIYSA